MNSGTQRSVTQVITPSAPSDTRAARNSSGSCSSLTSCTTPSAVTSRSPTTCADRFGNPIPVPCVAVDRAPASCWRSMSPWFSIASSRSASSLPSRCRVIPASTSTSAPSAETTRSSASSRSITSSVQAMSVNEWPEAETRTCRPSPAARRTASATASSDWGRSIRRGAQRCSPDQLRHCSGM